MLDAHTIQARIRAGLPDAEVEVRDLTGTGDHFEARVVCPRFAGMSMIDQHQTVYGPLQDLLATGELHALALKTYSPEQWQKAQARKP
jgi:acid stress-induced BolA-like protein IbaG/YrbA